jgi:hypothetical protein
VSFGSLAVSIISAVIAWKAKKQAQKAATLEPRTEAMNYVRNAIDDVVRHTSVLIVAGLNNPG